MRLLRHLESPIGDRHERAVRHVPSAIENGRQEESYYGTPALKPAPWDWKVPLYIAIGGAAGSAQVIAGLAKASGAGDGDDMARAARYLGLAGSLAGAPLLIFDLKTPRRWFNMMRIARATSPMSIGSYTLVGFGAVSALGALGQMAQDAGAGPWARRLAGATLAPAAVTGALMSTYTAALLTATSTPLWAAAPEALGVRFGASAMASGAAALSLAGLARGRDTRRLDAIGALASLVGLGAALAAEARYREVGVAGAKQEGAEKRMHGAALLVGYAVPLACHAANLLRRRPSGALSAGAALATLAGSWLMRSSVIRAGNESARRPEDSLGFAQARHLPAGEGARRFAPPTRRGRTRLQRLSGEG